MFRYVLLVRSLEIVKACWRFRFSYLIKVSVKKSLIEAWGLNKLLFLPEAQIQFCSKLTIREIIVVFMFIMFTLLLQSEGMKENSSSISMGPRYS